MRASDIGLSPYRAPKEVAIRAMCELVIKAEIEKGFCAPIPKDHPWHLVDPDDYGAGLIRSWGYANDSGFAIPYADVKAVIDRICDAFDEPPAGYTRRMEVTVYDNGRSIYFRGLNVMGYVSLIYAMDIWHDFRLMLLPAHDREGFSDYFMERSHRGR